MGLFVPMDFYWFFCMYDQFISFYLWCMLGGKVWLWMKETYFGSLRAKGHFSTSWHAEMSLTLIELIYNVGTSKHALKLPEHGRCCIQDNQLPTKSQVESEDNNFSFKSLCELAFEASEREWMCLVFQVRQGRSICSSSGTTGWWTSCCRSPWVP